VSRRLKEKAAEARACGLATVVPFARLRRVGMESMHRVAWVAATLLLMALFFAAGRMTLGARIMPEIVATLPNDESQFSRELDARLRERFPVGRAKTSSSATSLGQTLFPIGLNTPPVPANSFSTV
jgi:hypothetical protein